MTIIHSSSTRIAVAQRSARWKSNIRARASPAFRTHPMGGSVLVFKFRACVAQRILPLRYCFRTICRSGWRIIVPALVFLASSCSSTRGQKQALDRFEYQRPEMGVPFRIVLYARNQSTDDCAADAAFERIKQLNAIMSDYDSESELSKLSHASGQSREIHVSDDLWLVLQRAQSLAQR